MKVYVVFGYYSKLDYDYPAELLDIYTDREDAEECVESFESIYGRSAYIEEK